jgi:hypothetical protein
VTDPDPLTPSRCADATAAGVGLRRAGWLAIVFGVVGVALIPWTLFLAVTLPARHEQHAYALTWAGFDVALAGLLAATAVGLVRGRMWLQGVSAAAAALLVCDAWFDILGSNAGAERNAAIALALFAELPTAALCVAIARRSETAAHCAQAYVQAALHRRAALDRARSERTVEAPEPAVSRR